MIEFRHFTYYYPNTAKAALHDLSFEIPAGSFTLLAGPSGAGKSTLLRAICGLAPHFSGGRVAGQVHVSGHDPVREGPRSLNRVVGVVFQIPEAQAILDRVEADIAFSLENAAVPPDIMQERVGILLDLLDLTALRDRPLSTLSGGERQRVAIASALALRPQVLVLDEPTSQLDPQAAETVLAALRRLKEELNITIVLAEHRLERVLPYADAVVALEAGSVVCAGPLPEVSSELPQVPPVVALGRALGWRPLPRTVVEARRHLKSVPLPFVRGRSSSTRPGPNGRNPLLETEDVHFSYGDKAILRGISLSVHAGEIVALLGPNGAGKSTLLRCIVGLLRPEQGRIAVAGKQVSGRAVAEICRDVAYLPQSPDDLLFAESVRQELTTTLENHELPVTDQLLESVMEQLGLARHADAYPRDLSVGERQRVALGAIIVTRPPLLLLDEPTRGLDYRAKERLVTLWERWRSTGAGLLLVTHDVELVAQVADRVIILEEGAVVDSGPASAVLGRSPRFAPQMACLFPGSGWLTVADVLEGLDRPRRFPNGTARKMIRDRPQ